MNQQIETLPIERRAELCAGADTWHTADVPELGLPALRMTDGPNGARGHVYDGSTSVCFPVGSALGATWNTDLIEAVGRALAFESAKKGAGLLLAPTVNLQRHPLAGRNFECFSEDPYLTSRLAVAYVTGLQGAGVGACVKHFVANESEYQRHTMSSDVDQRTLREVYLRPFERVVVECGVWAVMSSYNRINGIAASDNAWLLTDVLRDEWGFEGTVISDWLGTRSTTEAIKAGLDLEMPGPARWRGTKLVEAVRSGSVTDQELTAAATNVVRLIERAASSREATAIDASAIDADAVAHRAAVEAMVLLKNDGILPLDPTRRIAVVGPNSTPGEIRGGGSSAVKPESPVAPLDGLAERFTMLDATFLPGCSAGRYCPPLVTDRIVDGEGSAGVTVEVFERPGCAGEAAARYRSDSMSQTFYGDVEGVSDPQRMSARVSGVFTARTTGTHRLGFAVRGSARVLVDGAETIDIDSRASRGETFNGFGTDEHITELFLTEGESIHLAVEFDRSETAMSDGFMLGLAEPEQADQFEAALDAAAGADVAVVVVGLNHEWETEGCDRSSLDLPGRQDELVTEIAARNPNTVVVVNAGSPISMPWVDDVAAIVMAWYPGQSFGTALAEVLVGDSSPSGKLPVTWPTRIEDTPAYSWYPGENGHVAYGEGIYVGHRHFDREGIEPMFPFGHGLGYTTFAYRRLEVVNIGDDAIDVAVEVTNTGDRAGAEIAQLYVRRPESAADGPVRQLCGFAKTELDPGRTHRVLFRIARHDIAAWDADRCAFVCEAGPIEFSVGASSRDLRVTARTTLATEAVSPSLRHRTTPSHVPSDTAPVDSGLRDPSPL